MIRRLFLLLLLAPVLRGQPAEPSPQIINQYGAGRIALGEKLGSLKASLDPNAIQLGATTKSGKLLKGAACEGLRVEAGWPYDGKDDNTRSVVRIQAVGLPWSTPEALHPGASLQETEKIYGPLKYVDRYVYGREEAHFKNQPGWLHLILNSGETTAGNYIGDAGQARSLRENRNIIISALEIDRDEVSGNDETGGEPFARRLQFFFDTGITNEQTWTFFWALKHAATSRDADQISRMLTFPLRASLHGKNILIKDRRHFLLHFDEIFDARVEEAVRRQRFDKLFTNYQGMMLGLGEIWCDPVQDLSGAWTWKIKTFNNGQMKGYNPDEWFGPDDGTADHPWSGHD